MSCAARRALLRAAVLGVALVAGPGCKTHGQREPPVSSSSAADLPPAASAGSAGSVAPTGSAASLAPHYDVTSGIIELAEDGAQTGTEVVYFSDHGALETRDKTATLVLPGGAVTGVQHTVTVLRQDSIVVYNVATKSGSRIARSALADDLHGFGAGSVSLNPDSLQKLGAERVGQKTVAGLPCDV